MQRKFNIMGVILTEYNVADSALWNAFIEKSANGTIFHRSDFLAYHHPKFKSNINNLIWLKNENFFSLMPLGIFRSDKEIIARSPYGASWGGLVHPDNMTLNYSRQIVKTLIEYLKANNIDKCFITATPGCYYKTYSYHFEFSLLEAGFKLINSEIQDVVPLSQIKNNVWELFTSKCRNQSRKGLENFSITQNVTPEEFYPILVEDKKRHNNASITHSLKDLTLLHNTFPDKVIFSVARLKNSNEMAGLCLFVGNDNCVMTFYLSQTAGAVGKNGVNALIAIHLEQAFKQGYKFFDFGCSSFNTKVENIGVAEFKESFGSIGISRNTYLWNNSK